MDAAGSLQGNFGYNISWLMVRYLAQVPPRHEDAQDEAGHAAYEQISRRHHANSPPWDHGWLNVKELDALPFSFANDPLNSFHSGAQNQKEGVSMPHHSCHTSEIQSCRHVCYDITCNDLLRNVYEKKDTAAKKKKEREEKKNKKKIHKSSGESKRAKTLPKLRYQCQWSMRVIEQRTKLV